VDHICTISTTFELSAGNVGNLIPIGKPITNTEVYITDPHLNLVPIGMPGEICIGGDGLAAGYLNRPDLTAKSFVPNPFNSGAVLYKTGDIGRWLPDGNIEFLYRNDLQVKVSGYRIECEEIESAIVAAGAKQAVVIAAAGQSPGNYLVAYVSGITQDDVQNLRSRLGEVLPHYMVPAVFIAVEKFALNANGKIERKKLAETAVANRINNYLEPETDMQREIVQIWSTVLGIERIGINDNFFEHGGNSLYAIRTISEMNARLQHRYKYTDLYNYPTIRLLT
ncbi:MAG: non-ribosomal peptide synthetase, partial [Flammeovirgaceae bacterium]